MPDFTGNIERFTGFAPHYDRFRPSPPTALAPLLSTLSALPNPTLVVDLGCGTGLSTRYWSDKADRSHRDRSHRTHARPGRARRIP